MLGKEEILYGKAWTRWGDLQFDVLIEEMAELTKEICKMRRRKNNSDEICEELADVKIMIEQMELRFGKERCEAFRQAKLARLEKTMDVV